MELAELRAAVANGRRFTHAIGEREFVLVVPTQMAINCAVEENPVAARLQRAVVLLALRGWNCRTRDLHLAPDVAPDEPLAFGAGTAALLMDERPEWEKELCDAVLAKVTERREAIGAAQGN